MCPLFLVFLNFCTDFWAKCSKLKPHKKLLLYGNNSAYHWNLESISFSSLYHSPVLFQTLKNTQKRAVTTIATEDFDSKHWKIEHSLRAYINLLDPDAFIFSLLIYSENSANVFNWVLFGRGLANFVVLEIQFLYKNFVYITLPRGLNIRRKTSLMTWKGDENT